MAKQGALTEPVYYILLSLLTPMHGYGIMQNVKKLTNGRVNIGAGTLYGAINTLLSKGFIAEYKSDPSKKEYIITEEGRGVLSAELSRLKELVKNGEEIVSFFWGIRNDYLHEYYVILAGVDKEYEWYSPNISHLYLLIEEYYQNQDGRIRVIDFTRGGEGYKKTIGCTQRPVFSIIIRNDN